MNKIGTKKRSHNVGVYIFFFIFSLAFLLPFALLIAISLTPESEILANGFRLLPKSLTIEAYRYLFHTPVKILRGYGVTAFFAIGNSLFQNFLAAAVGYSLSRRFAYKKVISILILITMFFGGGIVPTYILKTQYLGLQNNLLVYILTGLPGAATLVYASFFRSLPESLFESAKLDGASEIKCMSMIAVPLSKPI